MRDEVVDIVFTCFKENQAVARDNLSSLYIAVKISRTDIEGVASLPKEAKVWWFVTLQPTILKKCQNHHW